MILITSGAYVTPELTAELGKLPPTFLPVGNKRLFSLQIQTLASFGEPIYISIPEDFQVSPYDDYLLQAHGVSVLRIPNDLTLAESILLCLNLAGRHSDPLRILHGDTLIYDHPVDLNTVSIGSTSSYYAWAECRFDSVGKLTFVEGLPNGGFNRDVLCGFFSFSDQCRFISALAKSKGHFISSLNLYNEETSLTPVHTNEWHDFGHAHCYYTSKHHITTQRAFNTLRITERTVVKSGNNAKKILAEAAWFENLPTSLKLFAPRMMSSRCDESGTDYEIERLYLSTLSELYVFGKLPVFVWERIFRACSQFLDACAGVSAPDAALSKTQSLYLDKTLSRLEDLARQSAVNIEKTWRVNRMSVPSLTGMAELTAELIPPIDRHSLVHGDLCFSNILYDFRTNMIQVIDPRGLDANGIVTPFGDLRYDVSKLRHSVIGLYDFIKADRYRLQSAGENNLDLEFSITSNKLQIMDAFSAMRLGDVMVNSIEIQAIMIHLFLSMLPLHNDRPDHQLAFIANAAMHYRQLEQACVCDSSVTHQETKA